jgi:hypothetical protein
MGAGSGNGVLRGVVGWIQGGFDQIGRQIAHGSPLCAAAGDQGFESGLCHRDGEPLMQIWF